MPELTVKSVTPGAKVGKVTFEEHPDRIIKFWSSAAFADQLKVGAKAAATFETVKSQNPDYPDEKFLKTWNGTSGRAARGGGGGGRPQRTPEEIASIMAQTALKEAVAHSPGQPDTVVTDTAHKFFAAMLEMTQKGKVSLS